MMLRETGAIIPRESFRTEDEKSVDIEAWTSLSSEILRCLDKTDEEFGIGTKEADWKGFYDESETDYAYYKEAFESHEAESRYVDVFCGAHRLLKRHTNRMIFNRLYADADKHDNQEEKERVSAEINKLNRADSAWQIKAIQLISNNINNPILYKDLEYLWSRLEKIFAARFGDEEYGRSVRTGVLGPVALRETSKHLGLRSFLPSAKQDAEEKVDLWVSGQNPDDGVVGVQVKSAYGTTNLEGEQIIESVGPRPYADAIDQRRQSVMDKCRKACYRYEDSSGVPVKPYWIEIGMGVDYDINPVNGKPSGRFLKGLDNNSLCRNLSETLRTGGEE